MKSSFSWLVWLWAVGFFVAGMPIALFLGEKQSVSLDLLINTIQLIIIGPILSFQIEKKSRLWPVVLILVVIPLFVLAFFSGPGELPPGAFALNFIQYFTLPQALFFILYSLIRRWWKTPKILPPLLVAMIIQTTIVAVALLYFVGI